MNSGMERRRSYVVVNFVVFHGKGPNFEKEEHFFLRAEKVSAYKKMRLQFYLHRGVSDTYLPEHVKDRICKSKRDVRSLASEEFAFRYLGITKIILSEDALISKYSSRGLKVPEIVAYDPKDPSRIISVEVKRICGNQLPLDHTGQTRRKLKRGNHYVWPWTTTVRNAFSKAHPQLVQDMNIHAHHIVFVIPLSLSQRSLNRISDRICAASRQEVQHCNLNLNHVIIHVVQGNDILFDRF